MVRVCVAWLLGAGLAIAQSSAPPSAAPAKPLAFDVISIRQNLSTQRREGPPQFGPTADGYRMIGGPLVLPIITAYLPQNGMAFFSVNQIKGLPDWAERDSYDIDAKVADEDLANWQNPAKQKTILPAMMQALLEDRFQLKVHREIKDTPVFLLTVAKNGPKLKESDPAAEHPNGIKLPWGGVMVESQDGIKLYDTSMASLATLLSSIGGQQAGRQIQDKTGLTGRYDIVINPPRDMGERAPSNQPGAASDPGGGIAAMLQSTLDSLGLKLESGKQPVETLVIDHIEPPSAN